MAKRTTKPRRVADTDDLDSNVKSQALKQMTSSAEYYASMFLDGSCSLNGRRSAAGILANIAAKNPKLAEGIFPTLESALYGGDEHSPQLAVEALESLICHTSDERGRKALTFLRETAADMTSPSHRYAAEALTRINKMNEGRGYY
jgi:hypothetical protein